MTVAQCFSPGGGGAGAQCWLGTGWLRKEVNKTTRLCREIVNSKETPKTVRVVGVGGGEWGWGGGGFEGKEEEWVA